MTMRRIDSHESEDYTIKLIVLTVFVCMLIVGVVNGVVTTVKYHYINVV